MLTKAKDLRNKENLNAIPDKAGYYKWWAEREELDVILKALNVDFNDVANYMEESNNMYAIYVGIATKSIRDRLSIHLKRSFANSTLRRSISSIVVHKYDKDATNEFIDKLYVEYTTVDESIISEQAKKKLENKEDELMTEKYRVLNISGNKHTYENTKSIIARLKKN